MRIVCKSYINAMKLKKQIKRHIVNNGRMSEKDIYVLLDIPYDTEYSSCLGIGYECRNDIHVIHVNDPVINAWCVELPKSKDFYTMAKTLRDMYQRKAELKNGY